MNYKSPFLGNPITPQVALEKKEITGKVDLLEAGPWHYMAGAQVVPGGLELSPTNLSIVNKREGDRIDPDPALNVYGPRLQAEGDFSVCARIQSATPVSLQLYGQVPLRFDDFRYERSRVECLIAPSNTLHVRIWDSSKQEPNIAHNFQFDGSPTDRQVEVSREGTELAFTVNGKQLGHLPIGDVFKTGEVWLGINSEHGVARVSELSAQPLSGHRLEVINTASLRTTEPSQEGLQSLVHKPGFHIGAAAAINPLVSDASYAQLFLGGELGSITTENALKPQNVQPKEGVFIFGEADALVELARRHGLEIYGHSLMYDKAMPKWMQDLPCSTTADKQRVREVLETHIKTVAEHFKGRIANWDVVNETIAGFNDDTRLQDNIWLKALGEEYIDIAFRAAHAADPDAKLYINDYGLETNPEGRGKFMLELVQRLQTRGVPIYGVGIQGHVYQIPRDTINPHTLRQEMDDLHTMRLAVRVTELDVTGANGPKVQADQYASVLKVCLEAPNCTGLTIWGMDDLHGSTAGLIGERLKPGNALLYTIDYQPKLVRHALYNTLRKI